MLLTLLAIIYSLILAVQENGSNTYWKILLNYGKLDYGATGSWGGTVKFIKPILL